MELRCQNRLVAFVEPPPDQHWVRIATRLYIDNEVAKRKGCWLKRRRVPMSCLLRQNTKAVRLDTQTILEAMGGGGGMPFCSRKNGPEFGFSNTFAHFVQFISSVVVPKKLLDGTAVEKQTAKNLWGRGQNGVQ